eukprot:551277-Alexandrium_andersonii.AAC.1
MLSERAGGLPPPPSELLRDHAGSMGRECMPVRCERDDARMCIPDSVHGPNPHRTWLLHMQ